MADLYWMAVILTLMSAEKSLAVDPDRLTTFVNGIKSSYGTGGMFSLAVSIPDNQNQDPYTILMQIYESDPVNNVKNTINNGEVYNMNRVVAAKKVDNNLAHAEFRVVQHLKELLDRNNQNDLVLFYIYASPCRRTCIDDTRYSILPLIRAINRRSNYAFVFTKPYRNRHDESAMTENDRRYVLTKLRNEMNLDNIFRCDPGCTRCSNGGNVAHYCIS